MLGRFRFRLPRIVKQFVSAIFRQRNGYFARNLLFWLVRSWIFLNELWFMVPYNWESTQHYCRLLMPLDAKNSSRPCLKRGMEIREWYGCTRIERGGREGRARDFQFGGILRMSDYHFPLGGGHCWQDQDLGIRWQEGVLIAVNFAPLDLCTPCIFCLLWT